MKFVNLFSIAGLLFFILLLEDQDHNAFALQKTYITTKYNNKKLMITQIDLLFKL